METVIITSIYNEIIEYYTNKTYDVLEEEDANYKKELKNDIYTNNDSDKEHVTFTSVKDYEKEVNNRKDNKSDVIYEIRSSSRITAACRKDDVFMGRRFAYRKHKSLDRKETDIETIRNYLPKYFSYLMKNVFYVDMRKYKAKGSRGSYFIYKKDAEIFRVILFRSVSQNKRDQIIRKWLEGKISEDDYHDIVELSHRLFVLIDSTDAEPAVKEQWIEALRIALGTDLAYTMTEVEFAVKDIFRKSLPFNVNNTNLTKNNESADPNICQSYFKESILAELTTCDMTAQDTIFDLVFEHLKTVDFEKMKETESFPPVEQLKIKSICDRLCLSGNMFKKFPNVDIINTYGDYFASIDEEYLNKIEERKKRDQERYQKNRKKARKKKAQEKKS